MGNLDSLSIFVGTGKCNGNCLHCAGKVHRKYAPLEDGVIDEKLICNTLKECYKEEARYLSISSSGEPTLSPLAITKTFEIINKCKKQGIEYTQVNLYSNGIIIGKDEGFCETYFPLWKSHGLKTIYITVHDIDKRKNARIYRVREYPNLELILSRIHNKGLLMRANLVLNRQTVGTCEKFISTINYLKKMGVDSVSAWPIRNAEDKADYILSPNEVEIDKMEKWVEKNQTPGFRIRLLREKNRIVYQTKKKLTLFPDGTLSNTWCNH